MGNVGLSSTPMTDRERFTAIMNYQPADRVPAYYFGQWDETYERWLAEGLTKDRPLSEQVGLDPDWEIGMWDTHGLGTYGPIHQGAYVVLEQTDTYKIVQHPSGAITRESTIGSSVPEHIREALDPNRESWERFSKALDLKLPERQRETEIIARKASELNSRDAVACCFGGSLYGWPCGWMGVEAISMLSYDDPALYEQIISTLTDHTIAINTPLVKAIRFEFAYIFEDCCGRSGPLFSPDTYHRFYHRYYQRLVEFYKSHGVKHVLLDSDGMIEPLINCWLDSGIDILFPLEVGVWQTDPIVLRRRFGKSLRMMGGFNKHLIIKGSGTVRSELERLKPLVDEGGFIPLPDHRIPPDCSLEQFREYVRVFRSVYP